MNESGAYSLEVAICCLHRSDRLRQRDPAPLWPSPTSTVPKPTIARATKDRAIADYSKAIDLNPSGRQLLQQSRRRLSGQGRHRPGHRRLQQSDRPQSQAHRRPIPTVATPMGRARRRGHRGLQQGNRDRSQDRGPLLQSRHHLPGQRRQRPRHRGLRQGDRNRSQACAGLLQSRLRLSEQGRIRPSHRGSHQGHRDRSPGCGSLQ